MQYALVNSQGIVQNIIIYDGESKYTPPVGMTLQQINNWVQIGQATSTSQPVISAPVTLPSPIPDLAVQLASALINANIIPATAINSTTLTQVNATLTAANMTTIAMPTITTTAPVSGTKT